MNGKSVFPTRHFQAGKIIFREGQASDAAYLIKKGKVLRTRGEKTIVLDIITAPEIFGEMAFINKAPRSATVEAIEDTDLIVITHEQLQSYLAQSPVIVRALVHCLSQRLKATTAFVQHQGADNNLTSACYCLSLMETSYPSDSSHKSGCITLSYEKALRKLSHALGVSATASADLLERLSDLQLIAITDEFGEKLIRIEDVNRLQTEARNLNRPTAESEYASTSGYVDISELANMMGTTTSKIKQKLASGDIPDKLIHFYKLELFHLIDQAH